MERKARRGGWGTGLGKVGQPSPESLEHSSFLSALVFRPSLVLWCLVTVTGGAGPGGLLEFESQLCFLDKFFHFLSLNGANCIMGLGRINKGYCRALSIALQSYGVPP